MAKIQRNTQKIFGVNAPADDIAALGSFKTGTPIYTDNISALQNAAYETGFGAALVANEAPFMEEQNSIPYILSTQLAYCFQEGIPEYDAGTIYYIGSIVKNLEENKVVLYQSIVDNNTGNPLTDETKWQKVELGGSGTSLPLFTSVIQDHILSFEESKGYALQGTYVYKTGVAGERYGYPDFVQKCIDEKTAGTASQVTLGENTITMYTNSNGHIFYDIADKAAVDTWFNTWGVADFYGVDTENERIFLPRNNKFMQFTTDTSKVNGFNEPGLPNITGTLNSISEQFGTYGSATGAFKKESNGSADTPTFSGSGVDGRVSFDASRSSAVYGNSDTVQVASSNKLLYYVVGNTTEITTVTTTIPDSEILSQVNKNTSDIADKLSRDDKAEITNWGMPDYSNKTVISAANTWYQATEASYLIYSGLRGSTFNTVTLSPDKTTLYTFTQQVNLTAITYRTLHTLLVPKGWYIQVNYTDPDMIRFYPLIGGN